MAAASVAPSQDVSSLSSRLDEMKLQPGRAPSKLEYDPNVDEKVIRERLFGTPYEPNEALWKADQAKWAAQPAAKRQAAFDSFRQSGLPLHAEGPAVWDGRVLEHQPEKWLYELSAADKQEVQAALEHFKALPVAQEKQPYNFDAVSPATFPLPTFARFLHDASDKVHNGIGLQVLRGLDPDQWSREEQIIVYAGIASYIGETRLAQHQDKALIHLRDLTKFKKDDRPAITLKGQTAGNQVAHTDAGDIVSLFTLSPAAEGGLSQIASVGAVYNWFAENRPDLLGVLTSKTWEWGGQEARPLIHWHAGRILAQYARRPWFDFFEGARLDKTVELPYEKHIALDGLHFVAAERFINLDLQKGDIEFINNLQVFHARNASEDSDEKQRHLLRLWLRNEQKHLALPPVLHAQWDKLLDNKNLKWPLEAWEKGTWEKGNYDTTN